MAKPLPDERVVPSSAVAAGARPEGFSKPRCCEPASGRGSGPWVGGSPLSRGGQEPALGLTGTEVVTVLQRGLSQRPASPGFSRSQLALPSSSGIQLLKDFG